MVEKILQEWGYRCNAGFPNYNSNDDLIVLETVLKERDWSDTTINEFMSNIVKFRDLDEAAPSIVSDEELLASITSFKEKEVLIAAKRKEIQAALDAIAELEGENKKVLKAIEKRMKLFEQKFAAAESWVAELNEVLKYEKVRPDYKILWEQALTKLNSQTQVVLSDLLAAHVKAKELETKIVLNIGDKPEDVAIGTISEDNAIKRIYRGAIDKFKTLFSSMKSFGKTVDNLPKLK